MRSFPSLAFVCALTLAVPALAVPAGAVDHGPRHGPRQVLVGPGDPRLTPDRKPQTSDGVVGPIAPDVPPPLRGYTRSANITSWRVVPGVRITRWNEYSARGRTRSYLMTVKWRTPGLVVDYGNPGPVRSTAPVRDILARDGAVAGVNGDFFDISDTGAPIGIGRSRQRGLLNGRKDGWNSTFSISQKGNPDIGRREVVTRIMEHRDIPIATLNAPNVPPDRIGVYTPSWGNAVGARVTDGSRRDVRVVQVRGGRVVSNNHRLPSGSPVTGRLIIGRGDSAPLLRRLKVGSRATVKSYLTGQPRMAITGSVFLVRDGIIRTSDDGEMHPRTAIGIDRDTHTIMLLVVDGRQAASRGYTLLELADKMVELGADEAINLDGGGSTTMVSRGGSTGSGRGLGVVNRPSDGFARSVANVVEVRYRAPSGRSGGR